MLECSAGHDAEALMVLYGFIAGPGSFECSEGGLFQSFLLALECKMFGSALVLGYRRVPQSVYCKKWIMWQKIQAVSKENGPGRRCSCYETLRLNPDL